MAALCAAAAISLSACGGDEGQIENAGAQASTVPDAPGTTKPHTDHVGRPTSDCSPAGISLSITVSETKFDKDCLAAPASQPFTISYDNKDGTAHNIAVLESHTATDVLYRADIFRGPKTETFRVPALRPGTYAFHCEVHPSQMSGTFIVR